MAAHRKSIIKEALDRLDGFMAIGESRGKAKDIAKVKGESTWGFTTGKIHSFQTRTVYQEHVLKFLNWVRTVYGIKRLEDLDARADDLASAYLQKQLDEGKSAYSLFTMRCALRLFFQDRQLATRVELPKRKREDIKRSRGPAVRDKHINLDNWQHIIQFCLACGLRRDELKVLRVRDVSIRPSDKQVVILVRQGKGGKRREVAVFPGREQAVLSAVAGKPPEARVFDRISSLLDIHSYRRQFAQDLYQYLSGRPLPSKEGRLRAKDYDRDAAEAVSHALGHNRIDLIHMHYLR
jgi:integrase